MIDILSLLVRSCITPGIEMASIYSTKSIFQEPSHHIPIPQDEIRYFLNSNCFTCDLLLKISHNNDSLKDMVEYLCWGDIDISKFFIDELLDSIKIRRTMVSDLDNNFRLLGGVLLLKDSEDMQMQRLRTAFNFDEFSTRQSIFTFLHNYQANYGVFVLKILAVFGELATQDPAVLQFLAEHANHFKGWVFQFLVSLKQRSFIRQEAQQSKIDLDQLHEQCVIAYAQIFQDENLIVLSKEEDSVEIREATGGTATRQNVRIQNDSFDFD